MNSWDFMRLQWDWEVGAMWSIKTNWCWTDFHVWRYVKSVFDLWSYTSSEHLLWRQTHSYGQLNPPVFASIIPPGNCHRPLCLPRTRKSSSPFRITMDNKKVKVLIAHEIAWICMNCMNCSSITFSRSFKFFQLDWGGCCFCHVCAVLVSVF